MALLGLDSSNYTVIQPSGLTANIEAATYAVTSNTSTSLVYPLHSAAVGSVSRPAGSQIGIVETSSRQNQISQPNINYDIPLSPSVTQNNQEPRTNGNLIISSENQSLDRRRSGSVVSQDFALISLNSSDGNAEVTVGSQSIAPAFVPMQQDESKAQILSDLVNVRPSAIKMENTYKRQNNRTVVPGRLAIEISKPKQFELDDVEQRLSATGNRSRW
jgi:hypothetical protein